MHKIISGPSAAVRTGWEPSAAARMGQGVGHCDHMTNYIHVLHMRSMYKIDRRGRGSNNRILGSYSNRKYNINVVVHSFKEVFLKH